MNANRIEFDTPGTKTLLDTTASSAVLASIFLSALFSALLF